MTEPANKWVIIAVAIVVIGAMSITAMICKLNGAIFAATTGVICLLCGINVKAVFDFYKEHKK